MCYIRSMQLSRLEWKEILRNLGPECEPEVRAKIEDYLLHPVVITRTVEEVHTSAAVQVNNNVVQDRPRTEVVKDGPAYLTQDEINAHIALAKTRDQEFTQVHVDAINAERRITWESQQRLKDAVSYEQFTRPSIPPGAGLERVAVGETNSLGEKCIAVDPESKCSTYVCRNGHAYVNNNSNIRGCTECFMAGDTARGEETQRHDAGAIGGEDSHW
jgi:hypothetical protein